jgi:Fe-S-cluster-containing dehydrogenase component/anaerobic selenocysteine-containing dehydrogenase
MANDRVYWKSIREFREQIPVSESPAGEFSADITDDFQVSEMSGISRKQFLALLTASAAFAAAGCSNYRDKGEIIPYTKKPEEITPGVPNYYASTCSGCAQACGILIKTREGRPIKVDGNPDHPINRGKICAKGQASILNLYDPNRLRAPQYGSATGKSGELTWKHADAEVMQQLHEAVKNGKEIAVITKAIYSPTTQSVLADFKKKYPTIKVYSYSLFNEENRKRAWRQSYGSSELPVIEWNNAKIIVTLEADILGTDGMVMEQVRQFTDGRDVIKSKQFNRLYSIEGSMSITGSNADYRLRLHPEAQLELILTLIQELGGKVGASDLSLGGFAKKHSVSGKVLNQLVKDLQNHRGEAMIYTGSIHSESVHIAVNYLNELLGNTKLYSKNNHAVEGASLSTTEEIDALVGRMKSGQIGIVIHIDSNPVYHLPKEFGYEQALKSVPLSIGLVESDNETSTRCSYVLPINHACESWGDYKVRTGVLSLQQPIIAPLYDTRQKEAVLLTWMKENELYSETLYHEYLMHRWEKEVYPALKLKTEFKIFWYSSLHDGVVEFHEPVKGKAKLKSDVLNAATLSPYSGLSVALIESPYLGDGSFANNGWLQELPHPISKIVWDNYAAISLATAKSLGVGNNDLIEIRLPHGVVTLPVFLQPGQADGVVCVALGYGRTDAGPVGNQVGVDVLPLLSKQSLVGGRLFHDVSITKASGGHELVSTQEHHSLNDEFTKDLHLQRKIIREGTLEEFERNPNFLHEEKTVLFSIAKEVEYNGVKWAMAIDLNKCIGCNVCVAGCNVENNIPVVGKEQAAKGRAMHWVRIDRYYSGTDVEPSLSHQPMLCQQCDNAPCENVCPVVATNHSPDGLNQMVYNRCVGTKYCSNNCPFKVRRFNFFNWRDLFKDGYYEQQPTSLVHNPEVTVRSRGVMEKCTFCIQRIMEARQHATEQGRELKGSDVKTACQDACPATAIVFGDMNDPKSEISEYRMHKLGYHVLEETNARPNVTYLAKLRNIETESLG